MISLRAYQDELKKLLFFRDPEVRQSALWKDGIPERLEVYRNNTRTNWSDTLKYDFVLTRQQFSDEEWEALRRRFFMKHPPRHWELNTSMSPFPGFLETQKVKPYIKELADFEWHELKIFIDRSAVKKGSGVTNPTAIVRVYQHQLFYWVEAKAPGGKPPEHKPEVLVFYRDSKNTSHIQEADPLMLLLLEHFRKPGAQLPALEALREKILPANKIPLETVYKRLTESELILG